jgi:hypothetical protein
MSKVAISAAQKFRMSGMHASRTVSCAASGAPVNIRAVAAHRVIDFDIKFSPQRNTEYYWHLLCQNIFAIVFAACANGCLPQNTAL